MKKIILAICTIALVSCASVGTQVKNEDLTGFKKGETTKEQVITKLGKPDTFGIDSDGNEIVTYTYAYMRPKGATFIPIVGIFAGGTNTTSSITTFTFKNNILEKYTSSNSELEGKMNLNSTSPK